MKIHKAFEGYKLASLADGLSPHTVQRTKWGLTKLSDYLHNPEVENIQLDDIRKFFQYLQTESNLSSSSIQLCWCAIRSFYNWAVDELGISDRPDKITMPTGEQKQIVPFSADDIKKLLAACELTKLSNGRRSFVMKRKTANRDRALVLFLLDSGLRVSECARLLVKDVNLETGEVNVKPFRKGRKSKSRIVYISSKTSKYLWRYLADREIREDDYLFVTRDGNSMNRNSIRQLLEELGKRANVKKVFAHRFRHTFAIQYLRNGGDVFTLQRFLGQQTLTMVKTYLNIAQVDLERSHRKASPVDNWRL